MTELRFVCPKCKHLTMRAYNTKSNFPKLMKNINHLHCSSCGFYIYREWTELQVRK